MRIKFFLIVFGFYRCDAQYKANERTSYAGRQSAPGDERFGASFPGSSVVLNINPERSGVPNSERSKPLIVHIDTHIDIYDGNAQMSKRNSCDGPNEVWYPDGYCGEDCDEGFQCYVSSKCFCKAGFKRKGGNCVFECPSDTDCSRSMVLSHCPRCVAYCDPEDTTKQPRCHRNSNKPNVLCEEGRQYCNCPEDWKWFNGSCVVNCPQERCTEDGLVYRKCYNDNWQKCPYYSENTRARSGGNCYSGCFCPNGTYYFQGRCIEFPFCPIGDKICNRGMEYSTGANPCSRKCSSFFCSSSCPPVLHEGCFCATGTYWDDKIKECVSKLQCFADSPRNPLMLQHTPYNGFCASSNEEFKCGYSYNNYCPEGNFASQSNSRDCIPGCFCIENKLFSKHDGKCVPKSECPRVRCPPNSLLQTECLGWDICYADLKQDCQPVLSCFCKSGYKRQSRYPVECIEENRCKASPQ